MLGRTGKGWSMVGWALVAAIAATSATAQISAPMRDRYDRNSKGANIDDFVRRLGSDDPLERLGAVKSLADSKEEKAVDFLLQALGDPDMRVKAKAIDSLGDMRATRATPVLIQHLFLRATDSEVKQRILASLGKIGDPQAGPSIIEFLRRDLDPAVQGTAIFALGEIGAPDALPVLDGIGQNAGNPTLQRLAREAATKIRYHQSMLQTEAKEPRATFLESNRPPARP